MQLGGTISIIRSPADSRPKSRTGSSAAQGKKEAGHEAPPNLSGDPRPGSK
jgi:hypothetical protein